MLIDHIVCLALDPLDRWTCRHERLTRSRLYITFNEAAIRVYILCRHEAFARPTCVSTLIRLVKAVGTGLNTPTCCILACAVETIWLNTAASKINAATSDSEDLSRISYRTLCMQLSCYAYKVGITTAEVVASLSAKWIVLLELARVGIECVASALVRIATFLVTVAGSNREELRLSLRLRQGCGKSTTTSKVSTPFAGSQKRE